MSLDTTIPDHVRAFDRVVSDSALVVAPSQDWGDYLPYYGTHSLELLGLITLQQRTRGDRQAFFAELEQRIETARTANRQVFVLRVFDPNETTRMTPWQDMEAMGLTRDEIREFLRRYSWRTITLEDSARTAVEILENRQQ